MRLPLTDDELDGHEKDVQALIGQTNIIHTGLVAMKDRLTIANEQRAPHADPLPVSFVDNAIWHVERTVTNLGNYARDIAHDERRVGSRPPHARFDF